MKEGISMMLISLGQLKGVPSDDLPRFMLPTAVMPTGVPTIGPTQPGTVGLA